MLKTAWILPLLMLLAVVLASLAPARAQDEFRRNASPSTFHDLPGVVPEQERVEQQSIECSSSIEPVYQPRGRYDILYGDVAPRTVYHCKSESSGVTYSGTSVPNPHWVPGLNPRHLPKEQ